ncbi:MAG: YbaN family protein [Candidatus Thalassarchaeaceae archaeon]|jgi:uncharacterized membrane protein YbaN (DUF454 family)|nr:MAG: hypothetical protein CND84_04605 [Marine Group II euryarchaeote MED-G35]
MERIESLDEIVERYCVSSNPVLRRFYFWLGLLFVGFAIIGIWVPGWPTVSWAVPAAFLFSYSSERMFRWTMTNRFFGSAMFEYYATGKTIPQHAKSGIIALIALMSTTSAIFVWYVSTLGGGRVSDPSSWDGADPGFGAISIILVGIVGAWYVGAKVRTREIG